MKTATPIFMLVWSRFLSNRFPSGCFKLWWNLSGTNVIKDPSSTEGAAQCVVGGWHWSPANFCSIIADICSICPFPKCSPLQQSAFSELIPSLQVSLQKTVNLLVPVRKLFSLFSSKFGAQTRTNPCFVLVEKEKLLSALFLIHKLADVHNWFLCLTVERRRSVALITELNAPWLVCNPAICIIRFRLRLASLFTRIDYSLNFKHQVMMEWRRIELESDHIYNVLTC